MSVVPTSVAVRKCIEALKANQLVAMVGDRDFGAHGVEMDFLGRRAMIPRGPAVFSIKTGAPIIPCFLIRNACENFTLFFEEPIFPAQIINGLADEGVLVSLIKKYITTVENKIRQYPSQWLMFREFWIK